MRARRCRTRAGRLWSLSLWTADRLGAGGEEVYVCTHASIVTAGTGVEYNALRIDAEERDALQVIGSSARQRGVDRRPDLGSGGGDKDWGCRGGGEQFKECRFPGRAGIVARAAKSGERVQ